MKRTLLIVALFCAVPLVAAAQTRMYFGIGVNAGGPAVVYRPAYPVVYGPAYVPAYPVVARPCGPWCQRERWERREWRERRWVRRRELCERGHWRYCRPPW